jgi:excisionase family DNA binding protein
MATVKRDLTNPPVQGPRQPAAEEPRVLVPAEAAKFLRLSLDQLYHQTSRKLVPFTKVGGALRFDRRRLEDFVSAGGITDLKTTTGRNGARKAAGRGSSGAKAVRGRPARAFVFKTPPRPPRAE